MDCLRLGSAQSSGSTYSWVSFCALEKVLLKKRRALLVGEGEGEEVLEPGYDERSEESRELIQLSLESLGVTVVLVLEMLERFEPVFFHSCEIIA